ncbi:MAG: FGGY family carbohydrate kinase [Candidatus Thorarchaeota archaeon]|nr:FGGY family carbohydrate kinase [Candidatus Thorarchaeota archaeon]
MSNRIFAIFDIGTTGTRSVLVDEEGRELSKAYEEYPPLPRDVGIHEQLTDTYWRTACNTMQRALTITDDGAEAVVGVVVATTRDCVTPIDKKGIPLAPTVTWVDNRSTQKSKDMAEDIGPRKTVNKIMWFIENRPQLFNDAYKFIHLDAFINDRLCGAMVSEPANARFGPIDHETLKWSEELCESTGIPVDKLVDIVNPGSVIGEISSEASKSTGLRKGTLVVMGSGDQQCSALGTGTIETGVVKATTGTGTFIITHTDEHMEDPYVMFSNPSAISGKWILEGVVPGTGLAYKWYRDQYCESEMALAARTDRDVYEIIESSAATIPAGSDGLVIFPFMAYNKGIFYNLGFGHTKAHVARAIMEANGYGIRMYIEMMEGMLDIEFDELRIDGGGANSPLWRQIQADCSNKTVLLPKSKDSTVIGAAMLGTVGTGVYGSYEEAVSNMFSVEERREPIPENHAVYEKQYTIYNKLLIAELAELINLTS